MSSTCATLSKRPGDTASPLSTFCTKLGTLGRYTNVAAVGDTTDSKHFMTLCSLDTIFAKSSSLTHCLSSSSTTSLHHHVGAAMCAVLENRLSRRRKRQFLYLNLNNTASTTHQGQPTSDVGHTTLHGHETLPQSHVVVAQIQTLNQHLRFRQRAR